VGNLQGAHQISGNFHIIDSKTIFLENFNYDGGAPGMYIAITLNTNLIIIKHAINNYDAVKQGSTYRKQGTVLS
jgi:hypothetical protein